MQVFLTSRYLAIAMEYVAGGDMFEYVVRKGGLKESEARWFFQQLIIGVDYLHRMVHLLPHCAKLTLVAQARQRRLPLGLESNHCEVGNLREER